MQHTGRVGGAGQLGEGAKDRQCFFRGFIARDQIDERAPGRTMQQRKMQKFGARSESGQADAPRVALDRGGSTRKSWVPFHVRKELADQGENHPSILSVDLRLVSVPLCLCGKFWGLPFNLEKSRALQQRAERVIPGGV